MKLFSVASFCFILLLPLLFSCSVTKPTYYFKDITRDTVINTGFNLQDLKIKKMDILSISISSLSNQEDEIFNKPAGLVSAGAATSGFAVDADGNIYIHKLGQIKAEGMTRNELKKRLENLLLPYLRDPVVAIKFANHYVTVIGEVGKPQILNMPDERMSITDMVAQSGNINPIAKLNDLVVIREREAFSKEFKHISLEDHSIFTSSWYYLEPNDVVVVNPDEKKVETESRRTRYQQGSSIVFQALTVVLLVYQVFFRK